MRRGGCCCATSDGANPSFVGIYRRCRLIYFGRMLDKIRLHASGQLPQDYQEKLGEPPVPFPCNFGDTANVRFERLRRDKLHRISVTIIL
ncbi:MAG: DUF5069 domain-containing protein [Chthoniobacterales bacterium]